MPRLTRHHVKIVVFKVPPECIVVVIARDLDTSCEFVGGHHQGSVPIERKRQIRIGECESFLWLEILKIRDELVTLHVAKNRMQDAGKGILAEIVKILEDRRFAGQDGCGKNGADSIGFAFKVIYLECDFAGDMPAGIVDSPQVGMILYFE